MRVLWPPCNPFSFERVVGVDARTARMLGVLFIERPGNSRGDKAH